MAKQLNNFENQRCQSDNYLANNLYFLEFYTHDSKVFPVRI